ncbi:hypothetical protein HYU16_05550 [Candidatus Woesearchaeota archaeon]|nr:hypothetical protein [Candidatus Woesearchaeota archaeon]
MAKAAVSEADYVVPGEFPPRLLELAASYQKRAASRDFPNRKTVRPLVEAGWHFEKPIFEWENNKLTSRLVFSGADPEHQFPDDTIAYRIGVEKRMLGDGRIGILVINHITHPLDIRDNCEIMRANSQKREPEQGARIFPTLSKELNAAGFAYWTGWSYSGNFIAADPMNARFYSPNLDRMTPVGLESRSYSWVNRVIGGVSRPIKDSDLEVVANAAFAAMHLACPVAVSRR